LKFYRTIKIQFKLKKICEIPGLWCIETLDNKKHADLLQSIMANDKKPLKVFIQGFFKLFFNFI